MSEGGEVDGQVKLNAADLVVCLDTLIGSLSVANDGLLWKFGHDLRKQTIQRLADALEQIDVKVEVTDGRT